MRIQFRFRFLIVFLLLPFSSRGYNVKSRTPFNTDDYLKKDGGPWTMYPKQSLSSGGPGPTTDGDKRYYVNENVTNYGSRFGDSKPNYNDPGYGTEFGTSFPDGRGKFGGQGFGKKIVGLGVGPGFLGGAPLGLTATVAGMGVYHRYIQYKLLTGGLEHDNNYYLDNYYKNHCHQGCPQDSHCEWGICQCNKGFYMKWGQCAVNTEDLIQRPSDFDPFIDCEDVSDCHKMDRNMVCNTKDGVGKCQCRHDMRWNEDDGECQLYIDVDCNDTTYDSQPSQAILEAVNITLGKLRKHRIETYVPTSDDTGVLSVSPNITLTNSLLSSIDSNTVTTDEIREAFCRDVDTFSWELGQPDTYIYYGENYENDQREYEIFENIEQYWSYIVVPALIIAVICKCFLWPCIACIRNRMRRSNNSEGGQQTEENIQLNHS